jgi:hypothetical protein
MASLLQEQNSVGQYQTVDEAKLIPPVRDVYQQLQSVAKRLTRNGIYIRTVPILWERRHATPDNLR